MVVNEQLIRPNVETSGVRQTQKTVLTKVYLKKCNNIYKYKLPQNVVEDYKLATKC